jgi:hypothetical protein
MRRYFLLLLSVFIVGCASGPTLKTDYSGPNSGRVVLSMSAVAPTAYSYYRFHFRKRGETGSAPYGELTFFQTNVFYSREPDFKNANDAGVVLTASLPAGDYEIFNFEIFSNNAQIQTHYSSKAPFSIPFTVLEAKTTYIGSYQANGLFGKNTFGMTMPAGAFFVVKNESVRDLQLATKRGLPISDTSQARIEVPKALSINNPFFADPKQ